MTVWFKLPNINLVTDNILKSRLDYKMACQQVYHFKGLNWIIMEKNPAKVFLMDSAGKIVNTRIFGSNIVTILEQRGTIWVVCVNQVHGFPDGTDRPTTVNIKGDVVSAAGLVNGFCTLRKSRGGVKYVDKFDTRWKHLGCVATFRDDKYEPLWGDGFIFGRHHDIFLVTRRDGIIHFSNKDQRQILPKLRGISDPEAVDAVLTNGIIHIFIQDGFGMADNIVASYNIVKKQWSYLIRPGLRRFVQAHPTLVKVHEATPEGRTNIVLVELGSDKTTPWPVDIKQLCGKVQITVDGKLLTA